MDQTRTTRRKVLAQTIGWAGACVLVGIDARRHAAAKSPKATLLYQDRPHDGQRCADCKYFSRDSDAAATGTCALVEGMIDRDGWCLAYAPKA